MGSQPPGALPDLIDGLKDVSPSDAVESFTSADDGKTSDDELVRTLFKRIERAKKPKKKWEDDYEVNTCHDYTKGFQRPRDQEVDAQGDKRYQLNKILAAMKAKIPSMFYYSPPVRVRPTMGREDTPGQSVSERAALLQDTINTIIRQPQTRFKEECMLALKEAQWAFGVIEVGYDAEWGDNPFARKPPLVENEEVRRDLEAAGAIPEEDSLEEILSKLTEVPHKETFYVKQIPARQFYVSSNEKSATESMDWVAYWEWMRVEDVKRTDGFENTNDLKATAKLGDSGTDPDLTTETLHSDDDIPPDMVRVWKLWDMRERIRYVLAEGHESILKKREYESLPIFTLRLEVMPGEWYPIPPITGQICEQDEHNDSREYLRLVRKATKPRHLYDKEAFDPEELEKLETDEFNPLIAVKNQNMNAIRPVEQPSYSENALRTLTMSEQGFAESSGVSAQQRLTRTSGGKPTATEVKTLEAKGDVRESYEQQEFASFLSAIARGLIDCAVAKATLPMWVRLNSDPTSPLFEQDAAEIADLYHQITASDLEDAYNGLQYDVSVDIESLSPVSEQQHANRLMQALNVLASPGVGRLLSLSPQLLKLMLNLMSIRSESDQRAIMEALKKREELEQQMAAMNAPPGPGAGSMPGGPKPPPGAPPLPPSVEAALGAKGRPAPAPPSAPSPPGGTPPGRGGPPVGGSSQGPS